MGAAAAMRPPFFVGVLDWGAARGHLRPALECKFQMSVVVPAEWSPHRAMWMGFPSHAEWWQDDLALAQAEAAAFAKALAGPGGEQVKLMTGHPDGEAAARTLLDGVANTMATMRGATPALLTNTYGTLIHNI